MDAANIINIPVMYHCHVIVLKYEWGSYVPLYLTHNGSNGVRTPLPYNVMIRNYQKLDEKTKRLSVNSINELFLWDEVVELYNLFLNGNDSVLFYEKARLPMKPVHLSDYDCYALPTAAIRGIGTLTVKEGLLNFNVGYEYDMTGYELSNRKHKYRELYLAGRNEYKQGTPPKEDFWEDPKYKMD